MSNLVSGNEKDSLESLESEEDKMAENNKLPKLNIMILGKTGVGKSTLINSLFGENLAVTGFGRPVTQDIRKFETEDCPISI